uniref:Uncharacterized protein n=1 Tax=Ananas comosus var. bracteatus TaxID=296719 RepID=A0A6V7PP31_ANACO|nr:unnamed protein product [Ananas comosus var. bracteatus]
MECARAVAARDSGRVQHLMWMLNELSSAYGDPEQKIAAYFLQGLFARLTSSGPRTLRTLSLAADRAASFESTRRTALRFQELSPWSSFGHVAANGAILEAFLEGGAQRLHILDLSSTFCTQWPTLLEALATRSADDTPHLTITTVVPPALQRVMREIGQRMEKFARLMGVPFRFSAVHPPPPPPGAGGARPRLPRPPRRRRPPRRQLRRRAARGLPASRRRDAFLAAIRRLEPRIVTVVEEEADLAAAEGGDEGGESSSAAAAEEGEFVRVFKDALSNERLALERAAGRAVVDLVACPAEESAERRERAAAWSRRLRAAGFAPAAFSDDVADDVRSLLRRYREGWSMKDAAADDAGIFLAWKDQPVVWASAWRP